jgi:L,D-peptidoglycan transpeptidase YkuD (ErfK/YbiS/YcfS/YnhG family)
VLASSYASTTATLQAWNRAPGGGWLRYGSPVLAHVGSDGLSTAPSEFRSATPIGSFTLTQAFGRDANPGTSLPYLQTNPSDWWISQTDNSVKGCYNTLQTAAPSPGCPYTRGGSNEQLYATSLYDYAVVIDYNTRNSPTGVVPQAGSAFFLHVTDGTPTAGCVAIPMSNLVTIMRWLTPAAHPRILIGVA